MEKKKRNQSFFSEDFLRKYNTRNKIPQNTTDFQVFFNNFHTLFCTQRSFSNCSCIGEASAVLTEGLCPVDCGASFYLFMGTVCFMQMLGCTGRITNILINYRSVLPQDKTMAQGLALMLISLFAFIPGPIVFGKIIGKDQCS